MMSKIMKGLKIDMKINMRMKTSIIQRGNIFDGMNQQKPQFTKPQLMLPLPFKGKSFLQAETNRHVISFTLNQPLMFSLLQYSPTLAAPKSIRQSSQSYSPNFKFAEMSGKSSHEDLDILTLSPLTNHTFTCKLTSVLKEIHSAQGVGNESEFRQSHSSEPSAQLKGRWNQSQLLKKDSRSLRVFSFRLKGFIQESCNDLVIIKRGKKSTTGNWIKQKELDTL